MKFLRFLKHPLTIAGLFVGVGGYVLADYKVNEGTNTTIFAFVCQTTKVCPAHVNISGGADTTAGTEVGTAANPLRVNPAGGNPQPVTQSGTWTVAQGAAGTAWPVTVTGASTVTANAGTNLNTSLLATDAHLTAFSAGVLTAQAAATAGKTGPLVQCATTTAAPTYLTATLNPINCDVAGNQRVNVTTATGVAQASTTSGQTGSIIMGTSRTSALPTYGDAQSNVATLNTNGGMYVTPSAGTLGGATPYHLAGGTTGASTQSTLVKGAAAGTVYLITLQNPTATIAYFKLYDKATAPTCGSDTPVFTAQVSALATGYNTTIPFPTGIAFANGIGFCVTAALADNDSANPAAGINVNIAYR